MRVGRQPPALAQFTSEITQLLLGQPAFQIGPRIDTRGGVRLGEHKISPTFGAENMMEGRLHGRGSRGVGRNVPPQTRTLVLRPQDHGGRVPANNIFDAFLELQIAGIRRLLIRRKRVDVRGVQ